MNKKRLNKKTNKTNKTNKIKSQVIVGLNKKSLISFALFIAVAAGLICIWKIAYFNKVADQSNIVQIRELIILASRGGKKDAPVEAKTGDVYFPGSGLYLPRPDNALPLTYFYDDGHDSGTQAELHVSTYPVRKTESLYSANNVEELFNAVPHMQACSRGIKIVQEQLPAKEAELELKHTVRLDNGQDAFVYSEKDCPELSDIADLFVKLRSY